MDTKYYVDVDGNYLGGFSPDNLLIPEGAIEVAAPPVDARQHWNGESWDVLNVAAYRIYGLLAVGSPFQNCDPSRLPVDIDFKTGLAVDLFKQVVMDYGAPVSKTYYTDATIGENETVIYSNPVAKIEYTFERDSISLAISCVQKFKWYDTNGNLSTEYKEVKHFFNTSEKMAEAEQRRQNIISDLKVKTIGLLMVTENISQAEAAEMGRGFLAQYKTEIINYIDEANTGFYNAVVAASAETYPWLENNTPYNITIRQFILNGII